MKKYNKNFVDIYTTDKKYNIIYADPPWKYNDKHCQGAAEKHYNTMSIKELSLLPINRIAKKDCILFMWATYPKIEEALELIRTWGFTYKTIAFQWIKLNRSGKGYFFGLGRWTRGNTEPCLLATLGRPHRINNSISQLVFSPLRQHSQKPDEVRQLIAKLCGGGVDINCIELFARQAVEGWDCWGNEV